MQLAAAASSQDVTHRLALRRDLLECLTPLTRLLRMLQSLLRSKEARCTYCPQESSSFNIIRSGPPTRITTAANEVRYV